MKTTPICHQFRRLSLARLAVATAWAVLTAQSSLANEPALVAALDQASQIAGFDGNLKVSPAGPDGRRVVCCEGRFQGRFDLAKMGIDPAGYDLMKIEVKAGRGAFLRLSLENFPQPGNLSHWYVLDGMRGPFGWRTIWIDLRRPEEIKLPGTYKGLAAADASLRGLQITGHMVDTRRRMQEPENRMWLSRVRLVKKAIDLDWDQSKFELSTEGGNLVYSYPLTITNRLDRPATAQLRLLPIETQFAQAQLSAQTLELGPRKHQQVTAKIVLPAATAANQPPLYCERFEARATAAGIADSEVTILRSSDPIHLTVTVPLDEKRLSFPLLPRRKDLPAEVLGYDAQAAQAAFDRLSAEVVATTLEKGVGDGTAGFAAGISSAAFLYEFTGERRFLDRLRQVFGNIADAYPRHQRQVYGQPYQVISHGVISKNTLHFGFKFGGTQRPPYNYGGNSGNDASGSLHGIINAFDMVAADLPVPERQRFVDELLLPAGIQSRNHYFGPGNQQLTANYVTLYAGLAARNWPLVSFAYSSEHGLLNNLRWAFDDDGLCLEGHYQSYTINPALFMTEVLYGRGIDLYDERFFDILHSKGAEAIGMAFPYPIAAFLDTQRFAGKPFLAEKRSAATDGYHLSGSTLLKWGELEVAMNWGTHIFRGSKDRCALSIRTPKRSGDRQLRRLAAGGGAYNHSTFGQSCLVIDEQLQHATTAEVLSHDVSGPIQHVTATSDDHFPGSRVTRTFALLGRHVLVIDRVASDKPRTVDWQLNRAGGKVSIPLAEQEGSWTRKPDDNRIGATFGGRVDSHRRAQTSDTWSEGGGRLTVLGAPETEIITYAGRGRGPQLLVRRRGVKQTAFVAFISNDTQSVERLPVVRGDGQPANAVAIRVTLNDGTMFDAVANDEPKGTQVQAGKLKTSRSFDTNFSAK